MSPVPARPAVGWTLAGVAASVYYFSWLLQPGRAGVLPLFVALVLADLFNGFHAFSFWLTCLRGGRARRSVLPEHATVDVFVPTYNEAVDVLEPTLRAALALRGADVRVHLLDDGCRPEAEALAKRLGVGYIVRPQHIGAKAGNINHALAATHDGGAQFIAVFDSDHVPVPAFLERTLGLFVDAAVGLVQTPQVYVNADLGLLTRGAAEQQAIFFGPICTGRDGFGSAFCCGTNFVVRRDALQAAGGFPEDSVTEDIVLSTRLIGLGYEIAYVPEALSAGLGPEDAAAYVSQQTRWATGCIELLLRRRSLWKPLSWVQRWQYAVATSYWLTGWTLLVYVSLPLLRLLFGWQPVGASATEFATHFLPYFVIAVVNLGRFTGGRYTVVGLAMNWGSAWIGIRSTITVLLGKRIAFAVTPKHAQGTPALRPFAVHLALAGILVAASAAALIRGADAAVLNNIVFAAIDAALLSAIAAFSWTQARAARRHPADHEAVQAPVAEGPLLDTRENVFAGR